MRSQLLVVLKCLLLFWTVASQEVCVYINSPMHYTEILVYFENETTQGVT